MALEDANTPEVTPLGSPDGRFTKSPLSDLMTPDKLAGEGAEITGMKGKDPLKQFSPVGRHNKESLTYGTGATSALDSNDPFGNL